MRLLVAAVFLAASAGKALDFPGAVDTIVALGLPPGRLAAAAAASLVLLEAAIGFGMLLPWTMAASAFAAASTAAVFTLITVAKLLAGAPADCGCFGALLAMPPIATLVVDLALAALACWFLAATIGVSEGQSPHPVEASDNPSHANGDGRVAIGWVTAVLCIAACTALVCGAGTTQPTRSWVRALLVGQPAPTFRLASQTGRALTNESFAGRWLFLAFVKPGCAPCHRLTEELARDASWFRHQVDILLVVPAPGTISQHRWRRIAAGFPAGSALAADVGEQVSNRYLDQPRRVPFGVLVDGSGVVRWTSEASAGPVGSTAAQLAAWSRRATVCEADAAVVAPMLHGRPVAPALLDNLAFNAHRAPKALAPARARTLVLSFVSSTCPSCTEHIGAAERLALLYRDVAFVLVVRSEEEAAGLAKSRGLAPTGPVRVAVLDRRQWPSCGIRGVPTTYVLSDGRIWFATTPASRAAELETALEECRRLPRDRDAHLPGPRGKPASDSRSNQ
ncbi:MAG: redoxin domain-containing protein [Rubrivivax sp.]|nr:redoxin domain-containing protein [Rubrivivax sp.]